MKEERESKMSLVVLLEALEKIGRDRGEARFTRSSSIKGGKRYYTYAIRLDKGLAEALQALGWKPGDKLEAHLEIRNGKLVLVVEKVS